jgi:hypothetical protein
MPESFSARAIRAMLCPASRWPNIHSPSTVIARSSCSDAKSTRPPASGIHSWIP